MSLNCVIGEAIYNKDKYIYNKAEIRFIKGRLKFGNSKNAAPFPSMIVIFRGAKIWEVIKNEKTNRHCRTAKTD